jgi:hypothetical protein
MLIGGRPVNSFLVQYDDKISVDIVPEALECLSEIQNKS